MLKEIYNRLILDLNKINDMVVDEVPKNGNKKCISVHNQVKETLKYLATQISSFKEEHKTQYCYDCEFHKEKKYTKEETSRDFDGRIEKTYISEVCKLTKSTICSGNDYATCPLNKYKSFSNKSKEFKSALYKAIENLQKLEFKVVEKNENEFVVYKYGISKNDYKEQIEFNLSSVELIAFYDGVELFRKYIKKSFDSKIKGLVQLAGSFENVKV